MARAEILQEPDETSDEDVSSRLYLIGLSDLATETMKAMVSVVLDMAQPVAFQLQPDGSDDQEAARELRDLCASYGVALIVQDDLNLARAIGADGVYQRQLSRIGSDRNTLERGQILGAEVGRSRHDAMEAGENGADYVAFGRPGEPVDQEILDLVRWWRDLFVLPCLAFAETPEDAAKLALAGADFIGVSKTIWHDPDGPDQCVLRMLAAMEKN